MDLNLGDTQLILKTCKEAGLTKEQAAYVMATAYHETAHTIKPVRETLASSDAQAIRRLNHAFTQGKLKWVKTPYWNDGFFGRGYVQLTHDYNYKKATEKLGVDFVSDPSKVMVPEHAANIIVRGMVEGWFTGKKLRQYINDETKDYVNARRIVNGTDRASTIAAIARDYEEALEDWDNMFVSSPSIAQLIINLIQGILNVFRK